MQGNQIITIVILVASAIAAVLLGSAIGSEDQWITFSFLAGVVALAVVSKLGSRIWILIPIYFFWTGKVLVLPLPFSIRNLITMFAVAVMLLSIPLGGARFRGKLNLIDWCVALLMLDVLITFVFNPVGLKSMSSSTVGSRPYFEIGLAAMAYFLISNQSLSVKQARALPLMIIGSSMALCFGKMMAKYIPGLGFKLYMFNTEWAPELMGFGDLRDSVSRVSLYLHLSGVVLIYLFAMGNPLKAINPMKIMRFVPLILAVTGIVISGFRSAVVLYGAAFIVSAYVYGRFRTLAASMLLGIFGLGFVVFANSIVELPDAVQRSLSFLPGDWSEKAMDDAKGSGKWRFEMWEAALTSDEVIEDKFLGDGFGFNRRELAILERAQMGGGEAVGHAAFHEHMMLVGGLHSGPISSMRYVGILGFFIYLALAISMAVFYYRGGREALKTPLALPFLFFGLTWIVHPFYFVFVFGQYDTDTPVLLIGAAMLKMMMNTHREYREQQEEAKKHTTKALEV